MSAAATRLGDTTLHEAWGWPILRFRAMGSSCLIAVEPVQRASELMDEARAEIERLEAVLSRFRPDSELSRLNRAGSAEVGEVPAEVTRLALGLAAETCGLFDPTLLEAIESAGYDRDFKSIGSGSTGGAANPRRPRPGRWREVQVDLDRVDLPSGVGLDFGGVAKGWAAERVAQLLAGRAGICVDLGGDCAVVGPGPDEGRWPIGIDHGAEDLTVLALESGGVCTSTTRLHRWAVPGGEAHHIIDPTTGRPALTDLATVTVYDASVPRAEAWAKAVLIGGLSRGMAMAARAGIEALATGGLGGRYYEGRLFEGVPGARRWDAAQVVLPSKDAAAAPA